MCSDSNDLSPIVREVCLYVQRLTISYDVSRDPKDLDFLVFQVNKLYRILLAYDRSNNDVLDRSNNDVLEALGISLRLLEEENDMPSCMGGYTPQYLYSGGRGRPRLDIRQEQLEYLLHLGFTCPQMMSEYGLCVTALYSTITDQELDVLITQIKHTFPNSGYRLMQAHLRREGHRVTQIRVRESMCRVDPEGSSLRWAAVIQCRKYSVASPLSLWHLDGNHKLIR